MLNTMVNMNTLKPSYVQLGGNAKDWKDAIRQACKPLIEQGVVASNYSEEVIKRENKWPTGLPTHPIGIAIPHAETREAVYKSGIGVLVLDNPVKFKEAGTSEEDNSFVDVRIIFLLALSDSNTQIEVLKTLMEFFEDKDRIEEIIQVKEPEQFTLKFFS